MSEGEINNVGFFTREFDLAHSSNMAIKYPLASKITWTKNVTYGELVLLQLRVNDSDNSDLLSGGIMNYTWVPASGNPGDLGTVTPSGLVSDLGTGEYSVPLNTTKLASNGQFEILLNWSKDFYDSINQVFTLNVIYTTELFSSDAPGLDVPQGYDAELHVYFEDMKFNGIENAIITCNWTQDDYSISPDIGNPGHYTLVLETDDAVLDTHVVHINASKDFHETRTIILSVQVRELHTSAIPSTSLLSLPVGYTTSFTITYTDTDFNTPILGANDSIECDWPYYSVDETAIPGVYEVTIISMDNDVLDTYDVRFNVTRYGAQNHTFVISLELRTHLTSFYLLNPIDPTPYTGNITFVVVYEDVDTGSGIISSNVSIRVETKDVPSLVYELCNGTNPGEYNIIIPAFQWGNVGSENLTIYANWTGETVKYYNKTIFTSVLITSAPTDIFLGQSPLLTPYGLNASVSIILAPY